MQRDQDKDELHTYITNNKEEFSNLPEDAFKIIAQFSHSAKLNEMVNGDDSKKEGINMCKAIDDLMASSEERGYENGVEQGRKDGIRGMVRLCQVFGASKETALQKIMSEVSLTEEKAEEYLQKYWI